MKTSLNAVIKLGAHYIIAYLINSVRLEKSKL
jgi:hypothetical protein